MPLYEYRCTKCGHRFEKIQPFNAEPEHECPKCHGPLIRPLTAPAFQFKGAGWYVNDYAPKSGSKSSESAPESKTGDAANASTSDGKPAGSTASESKPAAASASESSSSKPGSAG